MRKRWWLMSLTALTLLLVGCQNQAIDSSQEANAEIEGDAPAIRWTLDGRVEPQEGQNENIGTAGLMYGESNGYLIVGGGANFPDGSPAENGEKAFYPDVYSYQNVDGHLKPVAHNTLDFDLAYGMSVTSDEGIYYIGGSPDDAYAKRISLITADSDGNVSAETVMDLPFAIQDGVAFKDDNTLYFGLGAQDGEASNKFYAVNLETKKIEEKADLPGDTPRKQAVYEYLDGKFYIFSGGDQEAYTDGYAYDPTTDEWTAVADVAIDGENISLLGGQSVKLDDDEMLVIGGFNKAIYDEANKQMGELEGDELQAYKDDYFNRDPKAFNWNTKILIYNAKDNSWRAMGEIPFDAPCGQALLLDDDNIFSINGEVKPGTRTNRIYSGKIED